MDVAEVDLDDAACLADAAAVLAARQGVDPLLVRLAAQPFDQAAVAQLRRWIEDVYPTAASSWRRLRALSERPTAACRAPAPLGVAATAAPACLPALPPRGRP